MELMGHLSPRRMSLVSATVVLASCLGPMLYSLLAEGVSSGERVEVAVFGSGGITLTIKFFNSFLRRDRARTIINGLQQLKDQDYRRHGTAVAAEFRALDLRALRTLFLVLNGFTPLTLLKSLLSILFLPRDHWKYPFPCWTPIDLREHFLVNFIWQTIIISFVMHLAYIQYSFIYLSLNQTISHMRVLCVMLQTEVIDVRAAVNRHVKIIKLIGALNDFISWTYFIELGFYAAQIALLGYFIIKMINLHAGMGQIITTFYVMLLYVFFAYFINLCGHKIAVENERIYKSIYDSKWVELPLNDQKSLKLMLCCACNPKGFRFRNLLEFRNEAFSHLMNTTYSFLTLLSNMEV